MGPWRPCSTSHFYSNLWSAYLMDGCLFRSCVRNAAVRFWGLFFGSEAAAARSLVSCIYGFGPAALYMRIFMFFELLRPIWAVLVGCGCLYDGNGLAVDMRDASKSCADPLFHIGWLLQSGWVSPRIIYGPYMAHIRGGMGWVWARGRVQPFSPKLRLF
jgi:hypothetical protein